GQYSESALRALAAVLRQGVSGMALLIERKLADFLLYGCDTLSIGFTVAVLELLHKVLFGEACVVAGNLGHVVGFLDLVRDALLQVPGIGECFRGSVAECHTGGVGGQIAEAEAGAVASIMHFLAVVQQAGNPGTG